MAGIWTNRGTGWQLTPPKGFPDEATLHGLVADAPQLLPLAGSPQLVVLGREVQLGSGYADLLAVENSGRPAIIEVKLGRNAEARRAVVAQVLAYAAYLHGMSIEDLQQGPLRRQLANAGHTSILQAVESADQEGAVNPEEFTGRLAHNLRDGRFRLVFVLDEVPSELLRLVSYLEVVSERILIDLVAVGMYEINGAQVVLPQRISPEPTRPSDIAQIGTGTASKPDAVQTEGAEDFAATLTEATEENSAQFQRLVEWAKELEASGYVTLFTSRGKDRATLLPYLMPDRRGLITIWNDRLRPYISMWRTVFESRAPSSIEAVELAIAPASLGQGTTVRDPSDSALAAIRDAYREAAAG